MALLVGLAVLGGPAGSARAAFGIAGVTSVAATREGAIELEAGSHPYEYRIGFDLNLDAQGGPEGSLRSAFLELPSGLVGNARAIPTCSPESFAGEFPACPGDSQVGIVRARIAGLGETINPLYNFVPAPGVVAAFGFKAGGFLGLEQITLRTGGDYGLTISDAPVSNGGIESVLATIWGVPGAPGHDAERTCVTAGGNLEEGCASSQPTVPLLRLPASCTGPLQTRVEVESVEQPGVLVGATALSRDAGGNPAGLVACERPPFDPTIVIQPTSTAPESPAGLSVSLDLPQPEDGGVLSAADLAGVEVELPDGMVVNPAAASGLASCSPQQVGLLTALGSAPARFTPVPAECPAAAKIGIAEFQTPLLAEPLLGGVYVADQGENPFGSLLAVYATAADPVSGAVLKLPGEVSLDPLTGKLTARFSDLPQLPFEALDLFLYSGSRLPLTTPRTCGIHRAEVELTPSTAPEGATVRTSPQFRIDSPPGGPRCVLSEDEEPFRPAVQAGATNALAGAYSPFVLRIGREDGTQQLRRLDATLAPGVTARVAGVTSCPDTDLQSCPAASRVGSVTIGAGSGPSPLRIDGRVYLAGPYRGAPLSLAIVTPAVAGPFDLGTSVVRVALFVDRTGAQVRAVSDALPTILRGIPLDIRSVAIRLDRRAFTVNPTRCTPMSIDGATTSVAGKVAGFSDRFRVGGCGGLGFGPSLSVRLLGPTHRGAHPELRATVQPREGDANIERLAVTLPGTELLDSRHIAAVCTRARFAAGDCPRGSIYGHAKAWTPLLDTPLEGPIYLRSSSRRLPDLAIALRGRIALDLSGRIDARGGRLRTTFPALPDVPVRKLVLVLRGGRRGLLVNDGRLCAGPLHAPARFRSQAGTTDAVTPRLRTGCRAGSSER